MEEVNDIAYHLHLLEDELATMFVSSCSIRNVGKEPGDVSSMDEEWAVACVEISLDRI